MAISVNKNVCIGCGSCVAICPKVFKMSDDGKSEIISQDDKECAQKAAESCPVRAITIE